METEGNGVEVGENGGEAGVKASKRQAWRQGKVSERKVETWRGGRCGDRGKVGGNGGTGTFAENREGKGEGTVGPD